MEALRNHEENLEISEDLRCKRSDGKQWRCTAMSMPDKTVCEKHYIQAKRRAANSALRASLKKEKKRAINNGDMYFDIQEDEFDGPLSMNSRDGDSLAHKKHNKNTTKDQPDCSSETSMREILSTDPSPEEGDDVEAVHDYSNDENVKSRRKLQYPSMELSRYKNSREYWDDELTESSEDAGAQPCHQCRKRTKTGIIWCLRCDRRGYCANCIAERYGDLSLKEIEKFCPACRGICFCRTCIRTDNIIKVRIREMPAIGKLQHLYYLLSSVLPVLKNIHQVQCAELEFEKKNEGYELMLHRTKLNADEQMCCNICRMPIIDYHRHCPNCSYDICLQCCKDLRVATEFSVNRNDNTKIFQSSKPKIDMSVDYPLWKDNRDGSIPCPPQEYGGCGCPSLSLNRIFKLNWVAKLVKNTEEMVDGCRLTDHFMMDDFSLRQCSFRSLCDDNYLFFPSVGDLNSGGVKRFMRHWSNGHPVVVTDVFESSVMSKWDPFVILEDIQETSDEKAKNRNRLVKAVDYFTGSDIDVALEDFIRGFSEGFLSEDGVPKLLKLKDWPSPRASEEFLLYQRPDFYARIPLLEFIHSKLGVLNVAAKLPHYSLQNDAGPKIHFSYGNYDELRKGNAVTNLISKICDMVYVLMHTNKVKRVNHKEHVREMNCTTHYGTSEAGETDGMDKNRESLSSDHGVLWDVFRREDTPKIKEYLEKLTSDDDKSACYSLYNGALFLNAEQKKDLKEMVGVEAWSFKQHVGQAVFVPAGCPFQTRNLQSTVQLELSFLSPESLSYADIIGDEIRCLPNHCEGKAHLLEVGKISLYAASLAIKEVRQLVLHPKMGGEIGFDDTNLTAEVYRHLQMFDNQSQLSCP